MAAREAELLPVPLCSVTTYVLASRGCAVGWPRARLEDHITNHYRGLRKLISPGSSRQCLVRFRLFDLAVSDGLSLPEESAIVRPGAVLLDVALGLCDD
jgi:hypothetical protein